MLNQESPSPLTTSKPAHGTTRLSAIAFSWRLVLILTLIGISIGIGGLWYLNIPLGKALSNLARLSVRAIGARIIEIATPFFGPDNPPPPLLGPSDWSGWPMNSRKPQETIIAMGLHLSPPGASLKILNSQLPQVNDFAAVFSYQPIDARPLQNLRERYGLTALVDRLPSQMDKLVILNDWVRRQWTHGTDGPINLDRFDAAEILEAAHRGKKYWCQIASMTFIQVVASQGYQARLLSLSEEKGAAPQHAVSEVWVDDLKKWVVFDTDFNLFYVDLSGLPLNALELHTAMKTGQTATIRTIKGTYRPEHHDIEQATAQPLLLPYYNYFYIDMRNDWITNSYFKGHPKRGDDASLEWEDPKERTLFNTRPSTSDPDLMYWPLNIVEVQFATSSTLDHSITLQAHFKTITPSFSYFEIILNGSQRIIQTASHLQWPLQRGSNTLTVRAANKLAQLGPPTSLEILLESPP